MCTTATTPLNDLFRVHNNRFIRIYLFIEQIEKRRSFHAVEHGQTQSAMAAQFAADQVQGIKRRDDGEREYYELSLQHTCSDQISCSICVFVVCLDDGKPFRYTVGLQEQPYRRTVKRFGGRRRTESKTIRGAR